MGEYADALAKDLTRLAKELEVLAKTLKKSPDDAKAVKSKAAIAALVTPAALKKRWALAEKMDAAELGKLVKAAGLPW